MKKKMIRISAMLTALLCLAPLANAAEKTEAEQAATQISIEEQQKYIEQMAIQSIDKSGSLIYKDWFGAAVMQKNGTLLVLTTDETAEALQPFIGAPNIIVKKCAYSYNDLENAKKAVQKVGLSAKVYGYSYAKVSAATNRVEVGAYFTEEAKVLAALEEQGMDTGKISVKILTENTEIAQSASRVKGTTKAGAIIYKGPSKHFKKIEKLLRGMQMQVVCDMGDEWLQVVWNGNFVYILKDEIVVTDYANLPVATTSAAQGSIGVARLKQNAFMYPSPDAKSGKLWEYKKDLYVAVEAIVGSWAMVKDVVGNVYVQTKYLEMEYHK